MNLKQALYIQTIAECGSITAAAKKLYVSQPSLSQMLRHVEEELGLEPFLLLGMRLGEGSGCPLAFQILKGACAAMSGMATFAEAAIDDGYLAQLRVGDAFTVS